jgi:asparagine synthase (glutamine-hydrolysing)
MQMCGICGFSVSSSVEKEKLINKMITTLSHRGPDDSGSYVDDHFALGNSLLSIVDVGRNQQPFKLEWKNETYIMVYNGEIYNYKTIRNELMKSGITFRTNCDTEVALAAFAVWGEKCLNQFDGQWAMAVWMVNRKMLFLSRDPFGIKPMFYWSNGNSFSFASEPKALFKHPHISKEPDVDSVAEYFLHGFAFASGYCLNFRSFYKNISSLRPGHYLYREKDSTTKIKAYFKFPAGKAISNDGIKEAPVLLRDALTASIRDSMMGDVPVGVALSGGLDSSIITVVAAQKKREEGNGPLLASCITYDKQIDNPDAVHAKILENYLKKDTEIHLVFSHLSVENYLDNLDKMIWHFDEPHWEVKQLAMFNNYKVLKENGAKVVLTGEGSDELNFGYFHKFPGFINPVIKSGEMLKATWGKRLPVIAPLFKGEVKRKLKSLFNYAVDIFYKPYEKEGMEQNQCMQSWYLHTFLHWLLTDNDRCSMAHSLEGRFPYLNRELYELTLRIPAKFQVGNEYGEEKIVLREAFRDMLPIEILNRPKAPLPSPLKLGFHIKIYESLKQSMAEVPRSLWDFLDKSHINFLVEKFSEKIKKIITMGKKENGGEILTNYLGLNDSWDLRTPQMFGILTLLRWWKINFQ